jgi:hypothetical protein
MERKLTVHQQALSEVRFDSHGPHSATVYQTLGAINIALKIIAGAQDSRNRGDKEKTISNDVRKFYN